jgi:hypothetical protein
MATPEVAGAFGFLLCAAIAAAFLRVADPIVEGRRRLNDVLVRRPPRPIRALMGKRPKAMHGAMYVAYALAAVMWVAVGLIGFVFAL